MVPSLIVILPVLAPLLSAVWMPSPAAKMGALESLTKMVLLPPPAPTPLDVALMPMPPTGVPDVPIWLPVAATVTTPVPADVALMPLPVACTM